MRPHPHKTWAGKYPPPKPIPPNPKNFSKKLNQQTTRLYARTSTLLIRLKDLLPQTRLNDREIQLQSYLSAERQTRGDGSPLHSNPQQVFTFSATDQVPANTVLDDFTGLAEPVHDERGLEFVMIPSVAPRAQSAYQRMVDRSHRNLVRRLVGRTPPPPTPSPLPAEVDLDTIMRMERRVSALGF